MTLSVPASNRAPLLLLILAVVLTGLSYRWTRANGFMARPPLSDSAGYRNTSLMLLQTWRDDGLAAFVRHGFDLGGAHPPGITIITAACARLRGHDEITLDDMWLVAAAFGLLSMFGCYVLARRFLEPVLAVAATAVAQSTPVIIDDWWRLYTQLPMVACILWAYSVALKSEGFTRRGPALAFGAWAGAAWMLKSIAPLYLIGAGLAVVIAWRRGRGRRALVNLALAAAVIGVIAAPWYWSHLDTVTGYTRSVVGAEGQQTFSMGLPLDSPARWLYYPTHMAGHGLAAPLAVLMLVALIGGAAACVRGRVSARALVMTVTLAIAYVILTIGQTQTRAWYVMGFVPLLAILLVHFTATRRGGLRIALAVAIAASCVFNHALTQRPMARDTSHRILWDEIEAIPCTHGIYSLLAPAIGARARPDAEPWPHREWVEHMTAHSTRRDPSVFMTVHAAYRHPLMNATTLDYEGLRITGRRLDTTDEFASGFFVLPTDLQAKRLRDFEFIVHDHRRLELGLLTTGLEALGFTPRVIETREVTEKSALTLIAISEKHHPPPRLAKERLEEEGLSTCDVVWEDGTRLIGHGVDVLEDGRTSVALAFLAPAGGGARQVSITARTATGVVRGAARLPRHRDDLAAVVVRDIEAPTDAVLEIALQDVKGAAPRVLDPASSDLKQRGPRVELPRDG